MANVILYVLVGLVAGVFGGLVGIGGATIVVPALVILFGFSQHAAQGTTVAMMIPPIGILAALTYYKSGYCDLKAAALLCIGFLAGGLLGAKFAIALPENVVRKIFGSVLFLLSLRMLLMK